MSSTTIDGSPKNHSQYAYFYVIVAVILWSSGGLFFKLTSISAYEVNLVRCLLGAITIAFLTKFEALKANKFTLLAALFYVGAVSFFAIANKKTTAANAIFLQYTAPIYILILSPIVLKEKFRFGDLLTVAICLIGMSFFFISDGTSNPQLADTQFLGNILGLLAGICLGIYLTLLRHPKALTQNPAVSVFYGNLFSVIFMIPFVAGDTSQWFGMDYFAVIFLGVFQIGLAYYLFTFGVAHGVRPLDASIIGFIEPFLNPIWVLIFFGEKPTAWAILGGFIIISAIIMHSIRKTKFI